MLEIGTGSGYQAAVLAQLAERGLLDRDRSRARRRARATTLAALGYGNVHVRAGDGYFGWPEAAPFDAIIVTAAAPAPARRRSSRQLREGGRIVAPVERGDGEELAVGIHARPRRLRVDVAPATCASCR